MDVKRKLRQIVDVSFSGKWAEIWFADGSRNPERYDECCKTYMLNDCIDESGLCHHIYLHGIVGVWVEWEDDRPIKASLRIVDLTNTSLLNCWRSG